MRTFFFTVFFFFAAASPVVAQTTSPIINEVLPAPSSGNEWIELFNPTETAIDLGGWKLEDVLTTPSVLHTFPTSTLIAANSYLVIDVSNKLNNTGDGVILKNAGGQIIDQLNYSSSQTDQSWGRTSITDSTLILMTPTRGTANLVPSPSPSPLPSPSSTPSPSPTPTPSPSPIPLPATIEFSEIMACPLTNETEWIELFNPDSTSYTLTNWKFKDESGNTRSFSTTIHPNSLTVIEIYPGMLNNDGDSLYLQQPDGTTITTAHFPACQKGQSMIWSGDDWQPTDTPTKGTVNKATEISDPQLSVELSDSSFSPTAVAELPALPPASLSPQPAVRPQYQLPILTVPSASISSPAVLASPVEHSSSELTAQPSLSPQLAKVTVFSLLMGGLGAVSVGTFGLYQWYTDQNAHQALTAFT